MKWWRITKSKIPEMRGNIMSYIMCHMMCHKLFHQILPAPLMRETMVKGNPTQVHLSEIRSLHSESRWKKGSRKFNTAFRTMKH
eukprot:1287879-Rhodomonas_salina.1